MLGRDDAAWVCFFYGELLETTREQSSSSRSRAGCDVPDRRRHELGDDPDLGDVFAFSPPVRAPQ